MEKQTVFIKKYPSKGQFPNDASDKATNLGQCFYNRLIGRWCDKNYKPVDVEFYFEEIELPNEEEIKKSYHKNSLQYRTDLFVPIDYYTRGANFILNHLKSNTNGNQHR